LRIFVSLARKVDTPARCETSAASRWVIGAVSPNRQLRGAFCQLGGALLSVS
jgi:hypothetical protein